MFVSFLRSSSSSSRKVRGRPSSPAGGLCSCYAVNWPPHKSFQPCTRASYPCKGIWGKAHEDKPGALAKFAAIPAGRCQRQQRLMSDLCWCKVRCWWGAHSGSSISRPPQLSPLCKGSSPPVAAAAAAAVHTLGCHLHLAHPGRLSRTGTWRRRGRSEKGGNRRRTSWLPRKGDDVFFLLGQDSIPTGALPGTVWPHRLAKLQVDIFQSAKLHWRILSHWLLKSSVL